MTEHALGVDQCLAPSIECGDSLIESMLDGFSVLDAHGVHVKVNDALCRMTGFAREELIGVGPPHPYWPSEELDSIQRAFDQTRLGDHRHYELLFMRKSGERFPVIVTPSAIRSNGGLTVTYLATVKDNTERKSAEKELQQAKEMLEQRIRERTVELEQIQEVLRTNYDDLRASEERFELVVRGAGVGIWDWNICTGKVYYSPRWKALLGCDEDEIGDGVEDWASRLHPDERETILKAQDDFLASTLQTATAEYRLRHKDGTYRWIIAHVLVVRDGQGRACRLVGSHGDITDRKHAEEALWQNDAKYRALVESCPDAVAMIDLQGRIIFASQRAAEQQGARHPDELVGSQAVDFLVEQDRERFHANTRCLMQEGIRRNDQYRAIRRNGTTFDAEISSAVIRNAAGTPVALMGVYRDVSDRKRVEEKLRAKDAELFAAAEIQARLLPQESPRVPGFDIAGRCYPAEAAAGDHFDYLWRPDGSLLIVLGDVSGHGLGPAIVAADFCARLRTLAEIPCELPKMAEKVNSALYRETDGEIFVTTFLGRLDPQARSLTYLNAGHPPAIILNSAGEIKARLSAGSFPFAITPETQFVADDAGELVDGDLILFYTDGLVEVRRRGQPLFGIDRAIQIVRANQTRTAAEIIESLHEAASQYAGAEKPKDDITVVIVKFLAPASGLPPVPEQLAAAEAIPPVPEDSSGNRDLIGTASFHADQYDDIAVIRFVDTKYFDTDNYAQLQRDLVDFVERQQPRKLLVDLDRIEYCSTALISGLLMAQRRVTAAAGTMKLFGLREVVLETLQHLNLVDTMLSVYADETVARDAF